MSRPIVCAACRAQALLRKHAHTVYRQKVWLSQSTWKAQDPGEGVFAGSLNNTNTKDETYAATNDVARRGRYSGQPLGPQHILDELNDPTADSRHALSRNSNADNAPRRGTRDASLNPAREGLRPDVQIRSGERPKLENETHTDRPSSIPSKLWHTYQDFCHASKPPGGESTEDHKVLEYLQTIERRHSGTQGLRELGGLQVFRKRCHFWMRRICTEWARDFTDNVLDRSRVPRPSQALLAISDCIPDGNNSTYPYSLWQISIAVAELRAKTSKRNDQRILDGTRELMRLWNLSMVVRASHTNISIEKKTIEIDWHFLPDLATFSENLQRRQRDLDTARLSFEDTLQMLLPIAKPLTAVRAKKALSEGSNLFDYPSAALLTLDLLQNLEAESGGEETVRDYRPWMDLMSTTFKSVGDFRVPISLAQKLYTANMAEPYGGVVRRFKLERSATKVVKQPKNDIFRGKSNSKANENASTPTSENLPQDLPSLPPDIVEPSFGTTSPLSRFVHTCSKRLGRAREQKDLAAAQLVHSEVRAYSLRNKDLQLPHEVYEALLYTFLTLRSPPLASSVWNDMINAGHQPGTKTYTIMMRGSQDVRNQDAMEQFWKQMRLAGLQPDRYAWTTRLFGLLRSPAHVDLGLQAMGEMGHEWIAAARKAYSERHRSTGTGKAKDDPHVRSSELLSLYEGDVNGVPRPDVVVMNSVVSALSEKNDDLIARAVQWARSFGVEPNITTYNVLINLSMRRGLIDEAFKILQSMRAKGVEANSTTWTVLLTAMFKGPWLEDVDSEEAAERVLSFVEKIDEVEGHGLDEKGYALVVDRLLKLYNNPSAAQKVLHHMAGRGTKPNTHLYTILMASYFEQSPPHFAAIESLWTHIQSESAGYGAALDATFYDRMIENYASFHEMVGTKPMLSYLEQMEKQGKRASWRALERIARALAEAGEWDRLWHIVQKARREREGESIDASRFGQRSFWQFIKSTGMSVNEVTPSKSGIETSHEDGNQRRSDTESV